MSRQSSSDERAFAVSLDRDEESSTAVAVCAFAGIVVEGWITAVVVFDLVAVSLLLGGGFGERLAITRFTSGGFHDE